ncbi:MAG: NupC/NupG family nucleoside CNT transporter [Ignavibacteriae bacterium HGW-Ignavibacteriae-1]|nr:MAG: NupC/NupG family nucleoside CNT transporter [Ignavibacteriae bacterium HGW-Ignavibacteriae-1]
MTMIINLLGIPIIFLLVWLLSESKREFPWRIVILGIILQFALAIFVLQVPFGVDLFRSIGDSVTIFINHSLVASKFMFGGLGDPANMPQFGFQFALIISSSIIFFSAFVSILYHYGIIQKIVYAMAWVLQKTLKTSGVESLSASANIFLGQTEAPLVIRHYLKGTSRSELFAIMTVGFATIAGGVMAAYIAMGIDATYLVTASIISAPGGLILSKIVIPPPKEIVSLNEIKQVEIPESSNVLIAISNGATDGVKLSLNIIGMLIAFISIIAVLDGSLGLLSSWLNDIGISGVPSSFKELLGYLFMPFAFLVGIPAAEAQTFGSLLGTKISVNEFLAYSNLSELIRSGAISERTAIISTFALCGFANFSSIAIQIGGIGSLVPERRNEIAQLGVKAMLIGALANLLTATIASLLI